MAREGENEMSNQTKIDGEQGCKSWRDGGRSSEEMRINQSVSHQSCRPSGIHSHTHTHSSPGYKDCKLRCLTIILLFRCIRCCKDRLEPHDRRRVVARRAREEAADEERERED